MLFTGVLALLLAGCGDNESGKYAGTRVNENGSEIIIEYKDGRYTQTLKMGDFEAAHPFPLKENKKGDLVIDNEEEQIMFTYKDKNTIYQQGNEKYPLHRVTDQK